MTNYDRNNVFYKIIQNEIPCKKIYEDEYILSFHDINPIAKVHALVITKKEYINFSDFTSNATQEEKLHFFNIIPKIASMLNISDYKLQTNNGKSAGQEVMHFHYHLISNQK